MVDLGRTLGGALKPGITVFLRGELGAGKTTLSRGIAQGLGHEGAVKSPTYTLVEPYTDLTPPLYHFDLYRLGDPEELEYMGIRDYLGTSAITVVEWPERGTGFLPEPDLAISIEVLADGRRVQLQSASDAGDDCIDAVTGESPD